jgi:serine-type D-Ala-D-Ala carboxypeptidase/endopeptidase (penicillin-binding protein 4)
VRRALAAGGAALAVAIAAGAAAGPVGAAAPSHRAADEAAPTPVAEKGTAAASKRSISRRSLRRRLAASLRSAGGASGAYVWDIDAHSHHRLFSSSGTARRLPASNEKLFTTAAAISKFGATGHLETRVYGRGTRGGQHDQVLRGNLVLVGDGDPALGTRSFAASHNLPLTPLSALAHTVDGAGVEKVTGNVLADASIFDRRRGTAATGGGPNVDLSPLSGLSFNEGFAHGHYARNPELVAAHQLKKALRQRGVRVKGRVGRINLSPHALRSDPLGTVRSPGLGGLIAETNKPSNNFYAEMLVKRLAARVSSPGGTRHGARKVEAFARKMGSGINAVDGSGLGRGNRVSPREVVRLLVGMSKTDEGRPFRLSLPVAGREGTVAHRMRGTAAQDRCRTKTGTLRDVSALSGYCRAGHGLIAFSILNNAVTNFDAAHRAQDHMAALIARYRR